MHVLCMCTCMHKDGIHVYRYVLHMHVLYVYMCVHMDDAHVYRYCTCMCCVYTCVCTWMMHMCAGVCNPCGGQRWSGVLSLFDSFS